MPTRTPQEVMEDRKIAVILDDLTQTCIDSENDAAQIARGKTFKALDSATKGTFNKSRDTLLRATEAMEIERDNCLDGKSKDLNKMKSLLTKQLNALDNQEEFNGRMQVLEDAALEATLAAFLSLITLVQGSNKDLVLLQRRLETLRKKLEKAIKATRDAKVKGIIGAGFAAIGLCLVPFGGGVAIVGGLALFGVETALGFVLKGNEETKVKKSWNVASGAGAVADGLEKTPKAFAPAMIIVTGAVDLREAFVNEKELAAVQKEIKAVSAEFSRVLPKAAKQFRELEKIATKTQKEVKAAVASVRSFKPSKGGYHKLPGMMR